MDLGRARAIRRLVVLAGPIPLGDSDAQDALFAAKRTLTASHVMVGLVLALAIPLQFSSRIRNRYRRVHRWLGWFLLLIGLMVGVSAFGMMVRPVGGIAWWHIRHLDVTRRRECFATSPLTRLTPSGFFGVAMWIGFTPTVLAAEVYIPSTRPATPVQSSAAMTGAITGVSFGA